MPPQPAPRVRPRYHHLIGHDEQESPQIGIVGTIVPEVEDGRRSVIAIDLDRPQCITVFGAPGGGKSYLLGVLIEMMAMGIKNINVLVQPITTVIFHFARSEEYAPEYTSMTSPNDRAPEVDPLRANYGAEPAGLPNQILLCPRALVEKRQREYPHIPVHALTFHPSELRADHWRVLMGAVGERSIYLSAMNSFMAKFRNDITAAALRAEVERSYLSDHDKNQALMRLQLAEQYLDETKHLKDLIEPGKNIIVDLRDEFLHPDDAFALLQVVLQIVANTKHRGRKFPKCVVFDEAHNYMGNPDLVAGLIETNRLMRHKRTSVIIASQDPLSVPKELIEMSTMTFCSKMSAKRWLTYLQEVNTSFDNLVPRHLNDLRRGEAYFWAGKSDEYNYTVRATKIQVRTRVTLHGGATILASDDADEAEPTAGGGSAGVPPPPAGSGPA